MCFYKAFKRLPELRHPISLNSKSVTDLGQQNNLSTPYLLHIVFHGGCITNLIDRPLKGDPRHQEVRCREETISLSSWTKLPLQPISSTKRLCQWKIWTEPQTDGPPEGIGRCLNQSCIGECRP